MEVILRCCPDLKSTYIDFWGTSYDRLKAEQEQRKNASVSVNNEKMSTDTEIEKNSEKM